MGIFTRAPRIFSQDSDLRAENPFHTLIMLGCGWLRGVYRKEVMSETFDLALCAVPFLGCRGNMLINDCLGVLLVEFLVISRLNSLFLEGPVPL